MSRESRSRGLGGRGSFLLSVALLLVLLGLLAWVVDRHDPHLDVTYGQRRTLAPQTLQVLKLLDRPVHVLAFYSDVPQERQLLFDLVQRYGKHTDHLKLEFVDLDREPERARVHDVILNRTVILSSGDLEVRAVGPGEAELTGSLVQLMTERPPRVVFLTGHGQASIEDASPGGISRLAELVRRQNFVVESWSLPGADRIPADVDVLVNPSPERRMTEGERQALVDYALRGGRMLVMVEPMGASDVDSLLQLFGLSPDPGFIVDPSEARRNIAGPGSFRIALAEGGNPDHPITRNFTYPTLYPLARSISSIQPPPPGVSVTRLVTTLPEAWSEMDLTLLAEGRPTYEEGIDIGGPLAIGFAVEIDLRRYSLQEAKNDAGLTSTLLDLHAGAVDMRDASRMDTLTVADATFREMVDQSRLVVTGDVDFVNNANLLVRGNSDLLLGMLLWLSEQENRIALAPRPDTADPIVLTENQKKWIRVLGIGVAPALCLLLSLFILWRRSRWL
jgi:hypothetical protein